MYVTRISYTQASQPASQPIPLVINCYLERDIDRLRADSLLRQPQLQCSDNASRHYVSARADMHHWIRTSIDRTSAFLSQFFVHGQVHGRPSIIFLLSSLITMQNLVDGCDDTLWASKYFGRGVGPNP